jgi:hypothetical protein
MLKREEQMKDAGEVLFRLFAVLSMQNLCDRRICGVEVVILF